MPYWTVTITPNLPCEIYPKGIRFAVYDGKLSKDQAIQEVLSDMDLSDADDSDARTVKEETEVITCEGKKPKQWNYI